LENRAISRQDRSQGLGGEGLFGGFSYLFEEVRGVELDGDALGGGLAGECRL
jgi:hypothetical protein